MSRSYKHTPYAGDRKTKWAKRKAKRIAKSKMNMEESPSPALYKRYSESWNICDYYDITTWREHLAYRKRLLNRGIKPWGMILFNEDDFDIEQEYQLWRKWYKRK